MFRYFTAIMEPKLKHWNQSSTCEKPMSFRRVLCISIASVRMTFSNAVRFWLTSNSLYPLARLNWWCRSMSSSFTFSSSKRKSVSERNSLPFFSIGVNLTIHGIVVVVIGLWCGKIQSTQTLLGNSTFSTCPSKITPWTVCIFSLIPLSLINKSNLIFVARKTYFTWRKLFLTRESSFL